MPRQDRAAAFEFLFRHLVLAAERLGDQDRIADRLEAFKLIAGVHYILGRQAQHAVPLENQRTGVGGIYDTFMDRRRDLRRCRHRKICYGMPPMSKIASGIMKFSNV